MRRFANIALIVAITTLGFGGALSPQLTVQAASPPEVKATLVAPPATAALLTDRFHWLMFLAAALGTGAAVTGLYLSYYLDVASGATMVLVSAGLFALALVGSPQRGLIPVALRLRQAALTARTDDYLKAAFASGHNQPLPIHTLAERIGEPAFRIKALTHQLSRIGLVEVASEGIVLTPWGSSGRPKSCARTGCGSGSWWIGPASLLRKCTSPPTASSTSVLQNSPRSWQRPWVRRPSTRMALPSQQKRA